MRRVLKRWRGSPALIVAVAAMVVALAGTAVAGVATISVLTHKEKKQVKKISRKIVNKKAASLTANLLTSSGFNENSTVVASLGATFVNVASANITTHSAGRVLATGSAELSGTGNGNVGECQITIDGVSSIAYDGDNDDIGTDQKYVVAVNFARSLPAGTHTASLQCRAASGTVTKNDAGINLYGLGT
jgi:hypothetical protein